MMTIRGEFVAGVAVELCGDWLFICWVMPERSGVGRSLGDVSAQRIVDRRHERGAFAAECREGWSAEQSIRDSARGRARSPEVSTPATSAARRASSAQVSRARSWRDARSLIHDR